MDEKIEPTDAMVDWAANILCLDATHTSLRFHAEMAEHTYRNKARAVMRTALLLALNHPDAAGLFAADADRPWEPLNGRRVYVGDEVREEWYGVTRTGVVGRVDGNGDPWTAEGGYIGPILGGTWYVRRTVKPLPTEPGTVIVPAEGHEYITATVGGMTYRAREAILIGENQWHAAWRSDEGVLIYVTPERIDAGTWKVGNR